MIIRWMIVGFVIWLAVAGGFAYFGDRVFTEGEGGVSWLFLTLPLGMFVLTYLMLKILRVAPTDRGEAAAIFAVPGMLIGIFMISDYQNLFPDLAGSLDTQFASLMFACYAAVIIAGLVSSRLESI